MKILVIEDNPKLAIRIKNQLRKWYIVETASSGDEGLRLAATNTFNTVLLDLGLPDTSGLEVCKQIRILSKNLPILVVTGIDTTESRVELLESGADDYITKPFDLAELRARINALNRRQSRNENSANIVIGELVIEPESRKVTRAGQVISLRRKEFDILECLALNIGRVMSRENIINHAWSSTSASWVGSVDVHIKQLRDKVDKPFSYPFIKTSYGVGYMVDIPKDLKQKKGES
ncbi:MAG: response regulator transcription factor [Candidatus Microsaccharimonas sp.]